MNKTHPMTILKRLFKRRSPQPVVVPPLPTVEEAARHLYGKQTEFADEVVDVLYSSDGIRRFVILKSKKGLYSAALETVRMYDEEEWQYFCNDGRYPAWWECIDCGAAGSIFDSYERTLAEVKATAEYKTYFCRKE